VRKLTPIQGPGSSRRQLVGPLTKEAGHELLSNTQLSKPAAAALSVERRKLLGPKPAVPIEPAGKAANRTAGAWPRTIEPSIESKLRNCDLVAVRADDGPEQLHRRPSNDSVGKGVGRSGSS
jgi:hypothetical protein